MGKIIQFPQKGYDKCPKCGNYNGPFERLGSGVCNECLDKSVKSVKSTQKRSNRNV